MLFGSRVHNTQRAGAVDLLVKSPNVFLNPTWLVAGLAASSERLLGGKSVDVLLLDPLTNVQHVHTVALATGLPL